MHDFCNVYICFLNDTTQSTVPAKPERIKRDFKDINTKISQWSSLSADATVTKVTQEINGGTNLKTFFIPD